MKGLRLAREGDVLIERLLARLGLALALAAAGCAGGPHSFRKITSPKPITRARAVSLGRNKPDSQVVPALVTQLADTDPVVRMAAHEELKKRTGRDFGFIPWGSREERARAVARWRCWLMGDASARVVTPAQPRPPTKSETVSAPSPLPDQVIAGAGKQ